MIEHLLLTYNRLLETHPLVAGILPLWLAGVLTFVLRNIPNRIWQVLKNQCTTSMSLLSTGRGSAHMQYFSFLKWFVKNGHIRWSRSLAVESAWEADYDGEILPGDGTHYFIWRGRPCWLRKSRVEQSGTTHEITHEIRVGMLGRNKNLLIQMVDEFRWKPGAERGNLWIASGTDWSTQRKISPRDLSTVILNAGVKERLVEHLAWFYGARDWYAKRGLPYRLVVLLEGPPGTGKTSLLRALAGYFNRDLCPLNIAGISAEKLPHLIQGAPANSFIVMEDFDASPDVIDSKDGDDQDGLGQLLRRSGKSALLQALDGIDVLDGQVIFLTTNHINRIDPALIRDERVNLKIHLGLLKNEAIHRYIELVFPEHKHEARLDYEDIPGSSLQKLYIRHHRSYSDFIGSIPVRDPDTIQLPEKELN